jgi:hypothetical protein
LDEMSGMSANDPKWTLTGHVMSFAAAAVSGAANGTSLIRNDRGHPHAS